MWCWWSGGGCWWRWFQALVVVLVEVALVEMLVEVASVVIRKICCPQTTWFLFLYLMPDEVNRIGIVGVEGMFHQCCRRP